MTENINVSRSKSGVVVLTDRMAGVRSATLGFFYRVGSRHEPADLNGISHFIEHTVFKGTSKRSALEIAIEQDRLGGNLDAFTSHEETGFAIKVIDDQLPRAFDLVSDILLHPRFDDDDLESEKRVIIEEMKMVEDSPEEYLGEIFNEAFFPSHPLGLNIAGTPESVDRFDQDLVRQYHSRVYGRANLIIAAAGNVDHQEVVGLAECHLNLTFEPANSQSNGGRNSISTSSPKYAAPCLIKQNSNLEQAHLIIASPFVSATDRQRYAADLLANIIGGGTSSRLWQKVREERGLAYSVGANAVMYQDCGMFSIFAGTSPEQVGEVVDLSVSELRDIANRGVTDDELELSKQQTVASILLGLEDSANRAATLAQGEMIHGRQISVDESIENFNAVTASEVRGLAREFFCTEKMAFAALGDLDGLRVDRERLSIQ